MENSIDLQLFATLFSLQTQASRPQLGREARMRPAVPPKLITRTIRSVPTVDRPPV